MTKPIRIGDRVRYYSRKYIRGSRSPACPKGRFTFSFRSEGVLLAKNDIRAWAHQPTWTQADIDAHLSNHLGLANATGASVNGDVTEGNNPVLLSSGEVIWVYATQIKPIK